MPPPPFPAFTFSLFPSIYLTSFSLSSAFFKEQGDWRSYAPAVQYDNLNNHNPRLVCLLWYVRLLLRDWLPRVFVGLKLRIDISWSTGPPNPKALISFLDPQPNKMIESPGSHLPRVVQTPKNLKYMTFPRSIDVNDVKELRMAAKECEEILGVLGERIRVLESVETSRWG